MSPYRVLHVVRSPHSLWSRALALTLGLAFAAAACTENTVETTSATSTDLTTTTTPAPGTTTLDPFLAEPLPMDPDIRLGRLDNGLTYYIKHNDSPGGRAELRLMVDAGSVQEEGDQAGTAHFLEHMMFNGTDRFPRNELIATLEAFGPRFGPDINAYTSFDETVYELSLPTNDDLLQLGIDVLREWAGRATLAEVDVVAERGVVVDEWRLRAQGFNGRVADAFQELILDGTQYEDHLPIGSETSIRATTPEVLERFYKDWYRPELMGVAAVGDFDVDEMEERIAAAFGDLENPTDAVEFGHSDYLPPSEVRARGLSDPEAASASVSVLWPTAVREMDTADDLRSAVGSSLAFEMLANRLNDDALRGEASLLSATAVDFAYTRIINLSGLDVGALPDDLGVALEALLIEVKRIRDHGFTDSEFQRAMDRLLSASEQIHDQQETLQDAQIIEQIVAHHLSGGHLMSPDQSYETESEIAARLTKRDLESLFREMTETAPTILAIGPDDPDAPVPEADQISSLVEAVKGMTVSPREDLEMELDALITAPDSIAPIEEQRDSRFGYTTLVFDNGTTVYIWESDIAADGMYMAAESFGGTSQVEIEDLPEAFLMTEIIGRSGIGPADVPTLQRLLSDRLVTVFPWVSETREGLTGSAAVDDVEILFQMVYLYMTAPRFDEVATAAVIAEVATVNESREDIPDILVEEALIEGYYGDDPRYFAFPSPEQMADFDVESAERVYRDRFGNAGDFVFAFVGDFESDEIVDLATRYIATLPGTTEHEGFVDTQPLPPRRVQLFTVEAGTDPQGFVSMYFTNELEPTLNDRVTGMLMDLIINVRLRDRIREEMSATYSVFGGTDLQRDPDPFAEAFVSASGDPVDLARISSAVMEELSDLQTNGPTQQELATAQTQLRSQLDLVDNGTIADALLTSYLYPDQPVSDLATRYELVDMITAGDVRRLARIAFNVDQRIEVRQVPRP